LFAVIPAEMSSLSKAILYRKTSHLFLLAVLALFACSVRSHVVSPSKFCKSQGGSVWKLSLWNSNLPPSGVKIGSTVDACSIPNESKSNVYVVPLKTLGSIEPTLAVLAFNSRQKYAPPNGTSPSANPADIYCRQLGGVTSVDLTFSSARQYLPRPKEAMGWWAQGRDNTWTETGDLCMFPDGSSMDEWTLAYHAFTKTNGNHILFAYNIVNKK